LCPTKLRCVLVSHGTGRCRRGNGDQPEIPVGTIFSVVAF
jgi:hypothetical protein